MAVSLVVKDMGTHFCDQIPVPPLPAMGPWASSIAFFVPQFPHLQIKIILATTS